MTKICDFPNPIYDLTEKLIPYGGGHGKEVASSKFKYTKIDTLLMTKMAKIDTLFMTKTAEKPYPLGLHIPT